MNIRTDFADEININRSDEYVKTTKKFMQCKVTNIEILKDKNMFNKERGTYVSIDFIDLLDENNRKKVSNVLVKTLHDLYKINKDDKILIVGLGNSKIIADSLGVNVADKIIVTNHLFKLYPYNIDDNLKKVCVFTPKVMGQTGLESADLVSCVCKLFKPSLTIIIDALATSSISRINKVIQISNTGIAPGSGVGNYRKELNSRNLKCNVISIGVATVVEAKNIINELNSKIKIPNDDNYNLILTPKEIDEDIEHLSTVIATSINKYIQEDFSSM